jgi:Zn-dependent M28 family amino/carboxypeptidase
VNLKTSRFSGAQQRLSVTLLAIFLVASTAVSRQATVTTSSSSLSITEQQLVNKLKVETIREVVNALSADDMEGRGTAQPGGDKAATYIADRFQKLGLTPLGEKNSYFQPIKFKEQQFLPETSMKAGSETLKLGPDFIVTPPYTGEKGGDGPLVFVAYGLNIDTPKRTDLAGITVSGKMVVLLEGPPKNISKESWKNVRAQSSVIRNLVGMGAAGIIMVNHEDKEHPYSEMSDYLTRRQVAFADDEDVPSFVPPFISVSDAGAEKLFAAAGITFAEARVKADQEGFTPINLKQSASVKIRLKKAKGTSNNVVGLLEGSDPKLKAEAVVFSAHYDAWGLSSDNRIYHGAADNALGVAEMLSIAETLSQMETKPRRSIIFMALTGEEYGGYGSTYWLQHPTWKLKQVAADLNLDGMGTEVYGPVKVLVGFGAEHSSLGSLLTQVATANGLKVIPDPMPEEKSFYRSDHYFFVKRGIPGLMWLGAPDGDSKLWIDRLKQWEKTDYHQPSDLVRPDWNWDGARTIAVVGLVMGLRVANEEAMPSWLPNSIFNRERGTDKPAPPEP